MWWERMLETIRDSDRPIALLGEERWGIRLLLEAPFLFEGACLLIDLESLDGVNPVAAGNLLSDCVFSSLGEDLCGYGRPYQYSINSLVSLKEKFSPLSIVVLHADRYPAFSADLVAVLAEACKVVVWIEDRDLIEGILEDYKLIAEEALVLRWDEARSLVPSSFTDEVVGSAFKQSGGAICEFLKLFPVLGHASKEAWPRREYRDEQMEQYHLAVDVKDWAKVWNMCRSVYLEATPHVIDRIGDYMFARGRFEQFWSELRSLPKNVQADPRVMYWIYSTSIPLCRHGEIMAEVDLCLATHIAPNLRALKASSMLGADALGNAELAYRTDATPVTTRAYGFLLASNARPYEAREVLRKAIRLSEEHSRAIQVVYSASAMANCELQLGNYKNCVAWSKWAIQFMDTRGILDENYRWRLLSEQAYGLLLQGLVDDALVVVGDIPLNEIPFGMPGLDGMYGTLGILKILSGYPEEGLEYLRLNTQALPMAISYLASLEYVTALEIAAERGKLREVAASCLARLSTNSPSSLSVCHLIDAIASFHEYPSRAVDQATLSLSKFSNEVEAPFVAQAAVWLAKGCIKVGDTGRARRVLDEYHYALRELSGLGWVALGGNDEYLHKVVDLFESAPEVKTIRVLGRRTTLDGIVEKELPLKFGELMILLQSSPQGLSREQLTLQMYGPGGNVGTLKATLSKLRREVDVAAKPYRLVAPLASDYQDVVKALEAGDVERAVDLYSGPLLPDSDAPGIVALREHLEESMRQAVLNAGDGALLVHVARLLDEDLELWEAAEAALPQHSPLLPLARAQVQRIRKEWGVEA